MSNSTFTSWERCGPSCLNNTPSELEAEVSHGTHQYALNDTIQYVMVLYSSKTNATVNFTVTVEESDEGSLETKDPLLFYHEEAVIVSIVACSLLLFTCIAYEIYARKRKPTSWDLHQCGHQQAVDIELCKVEVEKAPSTEKLCIVPLDPVS